MLPCLFSLPGLPLVFFWLTLSWPTPPPNALLITLLIIWSEFHLLPPHSSPFGFWCLELLHHLKTPLFKTVQTPQGGNPLCPRPTLPKTTALNSKIRWTQSPGEVVEEKSPSKNFNLEKSEGRCKNQAGCYSSCLFDCQLDYTWDFSLHRSSTHWRMSC